MAEAKREQDRRPTICCCVVGKNSCTAFTSGPDEPICVGCVRNKHPEHEFFEPRIKPWEEAPPPVPLPPAVFETQFWKDMGL